MLLLYLVIFAVGMGNVEAPNPRTVEAKLKAKWPPRGQATEHKRGPDPREVLYERNSNDLKCTGTCKSLGEPAVLKLKSGPPGSHEVKTWGNHLGRV